MTVCSRVIHRQCQVKWTQEDSRHEEASCGCFSPAMSGSAAEDEDAALQALCGSLGFVDLLHTEGMEAEINVGCLRYPLSFTTGRCKRDHAIEVTYTTSHIDIGLRRSSRHISAWSLTSCMPFGGQAS
eukprot:symbB.v1.2.013930.t1/scaffold996.1/size145880/11